MVLRGGISFFYFMPRVIYQAKFEFLDEIRNMVAETARAGGFSEKAIYFLQLAADEAATNIIEHAYAGVKNASFTVTCEMQGDQIVIVMQDNGKPFDSNAIKAPNLKADLSKRQVGGLGVYLMRKLMDSVHYESSKSGNVLTMTKRRE